MEVAPGATVRLDLGGTGRPVVGKAVVPAELAGRNDWLYGFCYLVRKPATEPGGAAGEASVFAPCGRKLYVFKVEPDGSFRIEDIEAGTYEMHIIVHEEPAGHGAGSGTRCSRSTRREVVVPAMPGGRSDDAAGPGCDRLSRP